MLTAKIQLRATHLRHDTRWWHKSRRLSFARICIASLYEFKVFLKARRRALISPLRVMPRWCEAFVACGELSSLRKVSSPARYLAFSEEEILRRAVSCWFVIHSLKSIHWRTFDATNQSCFIFHKSNNKRNILLWHIEIMTRLSPMRSCISVNEEWEERWAEGCFAKGMFKSVL